VLVAFGQGVDVGVVEQRLVAVAPGEFLFVDDGEKRLVSQ
jgi:hypothetical protein